MSHIFLHISLFNFFGSAFNCYFLSLFCFFNAVILLLFLIFVFIFSVQIEQREPSIPPSTPKKTTKSNLCKCCVGTLKCASRNNDNKTQSMCACNNADGVLKCPNQISQDCVKATSSMLCYQCTRMAKRLIASSSQSHSFPHVPSSDNVAHTEPGIVANIQK